MFCFDCDKLQMKSTNVRKFMHGWKNFEISGLAGFPLVNH